MNLTAKEYVQLDTVCKPDLLQSLGISRELCTEKTRMAALLNLARSSANQPIPYDRIRTALQIDTDQVEQWIVKASGEKLLTARIDQIHQAVSVMTCVSKGFDGTFLHLSSSDDASQ